VEIDRIEIHPVGLEEIIDLRHAVLRIGYGREAAYFPGDDHPQTVHLAAKAGGRVIACATVLVNEWAGNPACQLRGMAVDPDHQHHGLGRELLLNIEIIAREKSADVVWANCRTPAVPFYRKNGWEIVSEEFEIPTAGPHFRMIRRLS